MTVPFLQRIRHQAGRRAKSPIRSVESDSHVLGLGKGLDSRTEFALVQGPVNPNSDWGRARFWPPGALRRGLIWLLGIFGAYVGAVWLYPWSEEVAVVWLPNSVLVTALLRFRRRDWGSVYVAGLAAEVVGDLRFDMPPHHALLLGVVNALEATGFVLLAIRIAGGPGKVGLLSVRGTVAIVVSSVVVPAFTGMLGAAILSDSTLGIDHYLGAWRAWWFGDNTGLLVGVPIGLLLRDASQSVARRRPRPLAFAGGGVSALLVLLSGILAINQYAWGAQQTAVGAAVLLALNFGAVGAPSAAIWIASVTIIGLDQNEVDLGSVPRSQVMLFLALAAVYAIASTTESASRSFDRVSHIQERLQAELDSAAGYVKSLIPGDLCGEVPVSSRYLPSRELGGDCFDFKVIDDDHLIFWLCDVSGHGVAPALLSVSVFDRLQPGPFRSGSSLLHPEWALSELNQRFAMEHRDGHYLTIWYGVYQRSSRVLTYAGAGHPPALLLVEGKLRLLPSQAPPVGMLEDTEFTCSTEHLPAGSKVLLYSDGAFDLRSHDGTPIDLDSFFQLCSEHLSEAASNLDELIDRLRSQSAEGQFDDDCSIIELRF